MNEFYQILNLDERASLKEVCLAFDVLTKNEKDMGKLKDYRRAFEAIMYDRAPELFEGDPTIYKTKEDEPILDEPELEEPKNCIQETFSIGEQIPVNILKSFLQKVNRTGFKKDSIKIKDLEAFIENIVIHYDTMVVLVPSCKCDVKDVKQDLQAMCESLSEQYGIDFKITSSSDIICIKAILPYDIYCMFVSMLDGYCSNTVNKYNIKAKVTTLGE